MSDSPEVSQQTGTHQGGTEWLKRLEQVDRHVASAVENVVRDLEDLAIAAEAEAVGQLLAATARVDREKTQSDILQALLDEGRRFASRTAFFLTRPGEVRGWSGRGFEGGPASVEGLHFEHGEDSVWARMIKSPGVIELSMDDCAAICRRLDVEAGSRGALIPFVLRGQLGGVLYADRFAEQGTLGTASLQLLTHSAAQSIETAAVHGGGLSPALRIVSEDDTEEQAVPLWQPPEESVAEPSSNLEEPATEPSSNLGTAAAAAAGATAALISKNVADDVTAATEETGPDVEGMQELEKAREVETITIATEDEAPEESDDEVPMLSSETEDEATEPEDAPLELGDAEEDLVDPVVGQPASEDVAFEVVPQPTAEEINPSEAELIGDDIETAAEDIPDELVPEPELEDSGDLWGDTDDEPTYVDTAPFEEPVDPAPTEATTDVRSGIAPDPAVGQETIRLDIAALQGQQPSVETPSAPAADAVVEDAFEENTAQLPHWEVEQAPEAIAETPDFELEPEPESEFELEPDLTEPVTSPMARPDFDSTQDLSEDPTIMSSRSNLGAEPSSMTGGYVPPAPVEATPPPIEEPPPSTGFAPPPSKPESTGSTQVVPPTDIQGPGSAFAAAEGGAIPEGEEALHEEARRLARLLVSEIKLYNEEIIEEGRRAGNIYDRLKDDIDRSRQMYEERIDPRLNEGGNDYFRQELVQRLAGGDDRLLGY